MEKNLTKFNAILTVGGIAVSAFELMIKTFKWYQKRHEKKKEDYSRPIIKGL